MRRNKKKKKKKKETQVCSLGLEDPLEKGIATTPVFLPGEFCGRRSLVGYSPQGRKGADMTEQLTLARYQTLFQML